MVSNDRSSAEQAASVLKEMCQQARGDAPAIRKPPTTAMHTSLHAALLTVPGCDVMHGSGALISRSISAARVDGLLASRGTLQHVASASEAVLGPLLGTAAAARYLCSICPCVTVAGRARSSWGGWGRDHG